MSPKFKFIILIVLSFIVSNICSNDVVLATARELASNSPAGRSLLSYESHPPTPNVELIAAPNGTVYLIHSDSRKAVWSFPSGPPIYLSYHTPFHQDDDKDHTVRHNSFLDCGNDWELYLNGNSGKLKLEDSVQDYVKKTPIYEDDEVTVGSMHSTAFKVDPRSGRLIHNYGKSLPSIVPKGGSEALSVEGVKNLENSGSSSVKGLEVELYIERIDYTLSTKAFDKLLWNLTIGSFKAKVRCRGSNHLLSEASLVLGRKPGTGSDAGRTVSLPCEFEFPVRRFRQQSMFDYFLGIEGVPDPQTEPTMLPADVPNHLLPSVHEDGEVSAANNHQFRPGTREVLEINVSRRSRGVHKLSKLVRRFIPWSVVLLTMALLGFAYHRKSSATRQNSELNVESNLTTQSLSSRRRRSRRSGRSISVSGLEEGQNNLKDTKRRPNLNSFVPGDTDGRIVGKMFVSSKEIAKGSDGTVVYEGIYEGRKVAVKRMVQAYHDVAFREIQNLIASDQHPNIVRWHGVEYDHDFVYVALEHCSCSLNDLIESLTNSSQNLVSFDGKASSAVAEHKVKLNTVKVSMQDIKLWKSNGYPSATLLKIMRDMVSGLVHLHELGIIHRDIKPQNALIQIVSTNMEKGLRAKLSDMGISKRLLADMSSLGLHATGHGSSGWQAPEQLLHGRQTRAMDMFSLGCVLFFSVTGGRHPFGERFERDANIIKNNVDLFLVENIPEAVDLFAKLLQPDPQLRPKASEVLYHPFFWSSEMRLSFLHDASDRVELEDRESSSDILTALESVAPVAIGTRWNEKMEPDFINNIGHYRRYKYESVRDLLRVLRNKLNHYRELPPNIQALLGPVPNGFDEYFSSRFPRLLIEVYKVVYKHCYTENWFQKYLQYSVI